MLTLRRHHPRILPRLPWNAQRTRPRRLSATPRRSPPSSPFDAPNGTRPRRTKEAIPHANGLPDPPQEQKKLKPSLVEQLFPAECKRYEAQAKAARQVPRLPLEAAPVASAAPPALPRRKEEQSKSWAARQLEAEVSATAPGTAVLVLRNASKNLTEDDFRRLIPQGRHIEGWTLKEGDILTVIPARDLATLAHQHIYYILFSSALSAFTYQGHVTRIHKLAARHTPHSTASTIPPPPGWMVDGIDVHSAIQSYALVPPNQKLELRQLKPPLAPLMASIVRNWGYKSLVKRPGKMPYEARLTMEGPQLHPSAIRHILLHSGKKRGLSWSGGDNFNLDITRWVPEVAPSESDRGWWAALYARRLEGEQQDESPESAASPRASEPITPELPRRTAGAVYIVGFHTDAAAQSFISHWHRRPLQLTERLDDDGLQDGDLPPIANVELLW